MERTLFRPSRLPADLAIELGDFCRRARGDILRMTTLAGSGHPGGSMSSLEICALLWSQADVDPANPWKKGRDRILVSHGHISPAVYATLGGLGFFELDDAIVSFRKGGSDFEGHIERSIPGVELTTGNLGQGLSSACGMAVADRLNGHRNHTWVITGDGENQKGQMVEARRFASAYDLSSLTVVVDRNRLQICGWTEEIMPVNLAAEYEASGWDVIEVDGHDLAALYSVLRPPDAPGAPRLVIAMTVMGKGVSFMENDYQFHGKALKEDELSSALLELGVENNLSELRRRRDRWTPPDTAFVMPPADTTLVAPCQQRTYAVDHRGDNRSAFGQALLDLAAANRDSLPLVFDCDLTGSVKTESFRNEYPDHFFQSGIMEHHVASCAGGASLADRVVFWADFGAFAADETFNQHRLNDINLTNLKVVATHCGLDVGQDGKTHHCIKYISLMGALHHFATIVPADPNQTDRVVRYAATHPGNFFIAMGRSKLPVLIGDIGTPFYGADYEFVFGRSDLLREGRDIVILAMGNMCSRALSVREMLEAEGISAAVHGVSCPHCIDTDLVEEIRAFELIATYEDHDRDTGLGAAVALALSRDGGAPPLLRFGVAEYGLSGSPEELYAIQGLLPDQVAGSILAMIRKV
jgi:transketolase